MILERGNIKLLRLTEEKIELVRLWRNAAEIRQAMEYRETITPQMQLEWFRKIDNVNNNYFLIEADNKLIGLINGSDVDWDMGVTNNGGIFIWDKEYLESIAILQASLLLTDLGYYLGMKKNYVKVLKDNARAIAFNKAIGYILIPGQDDVYNQTYELTPDNYFSATEKIRQQFGLNGMISLCLTQQEYYFYNAFAKEMGFKIKKILEKISIKILD